MIWDKNFTIFGILFELKVLTPFFSFKTHHGVMTRTFESILPQRIHRLICGKDEVISDKAHCPWKPWEREKGGERRRCAHSDAT